MLHLMCTILTAKGWPVTSMLTQEHDEHNDVAALANNCTPSFDSMNPAHMHCPPHESPCVSVMTNMTETLQPKLDPFMDDPHMNAIDMHNWLCMDFNVNSNRQITADTQLGT